MKQLPVILKYLSLVLLAAGILGQTFSKCFIVLDYQYNKAYIAKTLCVNRDKPGMKCEGKCYLCKKLKTDEKKDQENPERKADNRSEVIPFRPACPLTHPGSIPVLSHYPVFSESAFSRCLASPFHPPRA